MGKPWKIVLVEDHTLLREGIRAMLSRFDEFVIVGEATEILRVSVKTVEKHRTSLMKKLDLHNVAALTALAVCLGLVVPRS